MIAAPQTRPVTAFITFFFITDTAPTAISTLSLHDALPISIFLPIHFLGFQGLHPRFATGIFPGTRRVTHADLAAVRLQQIDRKSTRLNSSHVEISYAVFCLKKKKEADSAQDST